jgi:hypothetical protein
MSAPLRHEWIRPPDHRQRMEHMRARAEWELGDEHWADVLFEAYEDPTLDIEAGQ